MNQQAIDPVMLPKRGMPVTIITGFLGSGKTTLLNHILNNNQKLKVAVLVNEFGDIDIDSQLLVSIDKDMVQLSNGCICCTINEDLVEAVYKVLEREDRVDYLVIETTGVADPLPIILTFLGTDLRDLTRLDSIITTIDAETFTEEHFESDAALSQITYGDIILLNKTDLAPREQIDLLQSYIASIKTQARIIECEHGNVPLELLLDVGYLNPLSFAPNKTEHHHHEQEHHHHDHHHHDHHHDHHHHSPHLDNDGFVSISYTSDRPLNLTKFQNFLNELPIDVFRAKGLLWFEESELRYIFQLSGKRFSLETDRWQNNPINQIVFIGRNLDRDSLLSGMEKCHADLVLT
jgi:G3E family GTPase